VALSPTSSGKGAKVRYPNDTLAALGLIAETFPRTSVTATSAHTSGELRFGAIGLEAGDVLSNVIVFNNAGGVAVTLARAAIYNVSTLALLASSADQSGLAWGAASWKTLPLSASLTIPATGLYYVGVLFVAGTGPTMAGAPSLFGADVVSPPNNAVQICGRQTGLAALPNPLVPGTGNVYNYAAVY
jgi:hypothetical protein